MKNAVEKVFSKENLIPLFIALFFIELFCLIFGYTAPEDVLVESCGLIVIFLVLDLIWEGIKGCFR